MDDNHTSVVFGHSAFSSDGYEPPVEPHQHYHPPLGTYDCHFWLPEHHCLLSSNNDGENEDGCHTKLPFCMIQQMIDDDRMMK